MKVLIAGGCGFVGYNLATGLKKLGYEIIVADNLVRRGSEINLEKLKQKNISFYHCDIRNKEDIKQLPIADIVLNCAAQPTAVNYANPEFDFTNNTVGVLNLLEYCRPNKIPIIQWSTNKCYSGELCNSIERNLIHPLNGEATREEWLGRDIRTGMLQGMTGWSANGFNEQLSVDGKDHTIYGLSKLMADLMVQEYSGSYGIPAICNRFSCIAGANQWGKAEQGWVTWFAIANELGLPIDIYGSGLQVRDVLFIDDLVNLIDLQIKSLIERHSVPIVYNVGGGIDNTLSVNEALQLLESVNRPWKKITHHAPRKSDQIIYISDNYLVSKTFSWKPTIYIEKGYSDILRWVKDNKQTLEKLYG